MVRLHDLDNAATTRLAPEVLEAVTEALRSVPGNPSSLHPSGLAARRRLEESRDLLRGMTGASEIVFTGGGTEATNLAMRGFFEGRDGGAILVGAADHPSVLRTAEALAARGHPLRIYPVDGACRPDLEAFAALLDAEVRFVSILHGNNEVGSLPPLADMVELVRTKAPRAHLHLDAVQAFAKIPLDLERIGADSMTIAAHKIHGPKGVGALALGPKRRPAPLITGGGQEAGLRSGTENVPGAIGFAVAAESWIGRQTEESGRIRELRDETERLLRERLPGLEVLGPREERLPHILSITFPGLRGEVLMHHLEGEGVLVSTGSACSQRQERKGKTGSHVLKAMGLSEARIRGALRISFGRLSTGADVEALARALPEAVEALESLRLPGDR